MITVSNLTKKYGDFLAVDKLSFEIEDGHIYGFLGPNGAGKSTTLNIMTGTLAATDGQVLIDGLDIFEDAKEAKKKIGYLPEIPPLYVEQTPREYLKFVAQAKGIKRAEINAEIEKVVAEAHIEDVTDKLIRNLSKGYRQRVGIAQALLGNPQVIILDEPTVGLDPVQIIEIRDLIHELGKKHTVILSSHILTEVQAICEKVLIIYKGKLVAFDTPENLQKTFSDDITVNLQIEGDDDAIDACLANIADIRIGTKKISAGTMKVVVHVIKEEDMSSDDALRKASRDIFYACAAARLPILQMTTNKASLEDIFIELTHAEAEVADQANTVQTAEGTDAEDKKAEDKGTEDKEAAPEAEAEFDADDFNSDEPGDEKFVDEEVNL